MQLTWRSTGWDEKRRNAMNRWQRIARFNVIVIAVTFALTGVAVALLAFTVGMPRARAGLGDQLINYRAVLVAYSIFWPIITAACMIPWFIIGCSGSIPVWYLPMLLGGMGITLTLVHSITILAQYGWRDKANE